MIIRINKTKMYRNTKKTSSKKVLITIAVALLVAIVAGGFYYVKNKHQSNPQTATPTEEVNKVNYNPPTQDEKKAGDEQKHTIVKDQNKPTLPETAKIVITDASQYGNEIEVRAFVSNVAKDGKCDYLFTYQTYKLEKQEPAYEDASSTQCIPLKIPRSELQSTGEWKVKVTYSNDQVTGSASGAVMIK